MRHLIALTTIVLCSTAPTLADITAQNVHEDRAPFEACQRAHDHMDDSDDAFRHAIVMCAKSLSYYTKETTTAADSDRGCRAAVYLGGSGLMEAYIISKSSNKAGAAKIQQSSVDVLKLTIEKCTDQPNIVKAAKGMVEAVKEGALN